MNVSKRVHLTNFRQGVRTSVFEEEKGSVCVCARAYDLWEDMKIFEGHGNLQRNPVRVRLRTRSQGLEDPAALLMVSLLKSVVGHQ